MSETILNQLRNMGYNVTSHPNGTFEATREEMWPEVQAHRAACFPELLKACKAAEAAMVSIDPPAFPAPYWKAITALHNAIAKAEGRE